MRHYKEGRWWAVWAEVGVGLGQVDQSREDVLRRRPVLRI